MWWDRIDFNALSTISLILVKILSRDAFLSDISNIHVSISERCGKLKLAYFSGSITVFSIIETIANDIITNENKEIKEII